MGKRGGTEQWRRLAGVLLAGVVVVGPIGCGAMFGPSGDVCRSLQSHDQGVRIKAIRRAARTGDRRAVPLLVASLEDDDADTRLFSVQALRTLTGEDFGYRYYENERTRGPAVERWRQWLVGQGDPAEGAGGDSGG